MLPTNEKVFGPQIPYFIHHLSLYKRQHPSGGQDLSYEKYMDGIAVPNPQHLYFLSDEEIKEGDWYMTEIPHTIWQYDRNKGLSSGRGWNKKIIATTDKSLNLPHTSDSFIEKYVEEYNKGNIITEVMVEYEEIHRETDEIIGMDGLPNGLLYYECNLKINPKDNTITIRKTKDSWNREEVVELMAKAFYTDCRVWRNRYQDWEEVDFDKWIEENL